MFVCEACLKPPLCAIPSAQDYTKEGRAGGDSFSADNLNWGYFRAVPLGELRRRDRAYMAGDRLLLRLDMRITGMETS